ncbi:MAG: segregation ATPase FtsK/SpoIIIE, family [Gaiellaceae bacterium]|jgi:S-DNA-T family DNA segregation ATPase FtsK/SpoIIIE|nr:segregation ATPase FtsK/SpoIIIE, family [Gaiellaceae bacterium]
MAARKKKRPLRPRTPSRVKRRTKKGRRAQAAHQHPELIGLVLAAGGLFLASLLYLGWEGGVVGEKIEAGLRDAVGSAAYAAPLAFTVVGGLMLFRSSLLDVRPFRTGLGITSVGLMVTLGSGHGGFAGNLLGGGLAKLLGGTGSALLGLTALLAGGLLLSGASYGALLRRSGHAVRRAHGAARRSLERPEPATGVMAQDHHRTLAHEPPVDVVHDYPDVISEGLSEPPPLLLDEEATEEQTALFDVPRAAGAYVLPDRSVLTVSPALASTTNKADQRTADTLVQALAHFGVAATIVGQIAGPRVTRYELQLAPGTKVSKVAALKDDLSYALATTEIRILAPIPGKQAVGVEVPNLSPKIVTLGDVYDDLPSSASPLAVWLGKDISGNAVWADLARMPHILIAGTTGSGKSGCINTILTSILLRSTPDEVRMILIDPKRIELNYYESIPHLLTPVVSSPKEASAVLTNVVAEMERRYERLSIVRARNLPEANRAFRARGEEPLPYLLVVIDELADLMMISPQAVEDAIIRLAQKSRAVGIHLVLATQRPSVDVITGMIKANVPSRIAFAVSSQTDSRVILDGSGAESLLGQGDMLFKPLGTSRLQRVQGAYVSEEEVALVVEQCRHQREQELDETLLHVPEGAVEDGAEHDGDFDPDEDPLLDKAIEIVIQTQTASVSLIQRRLRVGYTRAGRLIDMLERRGIISGYEGSKPRRVLVDEAELERFVSTAS